MARRLFAHLLPWALITLALFFGLIEGKHRCPISWCEECVPLEIYDAPGVGFDIGFNYG